jgi:hypothetical protein
MTISDGSAVQRQLRSPPVERTGRLRYCRPGGRIWRGIACTRTPALAADPRIKARIAESDG